MDVRSEVEMTYVSGVGKFLHSKYFWILFCVYRFQWKIKSYLEGSFIIWVNEDNLVHRGYNLIRVFYGSMSPILHTFWIGEILLSMKTSHMRSDRFICWTRGIKCLEGKPFHW